MLRTAFTFALRQAEDLMGSVCELMGVDIVVLVHSTVGRRAALPNGRERIVRAQAPYEPFIESTVRP
jgi:hypothetical protein